MRLLMIRHGDPDYVHDSLTEKGWREARLLRDRLTKEKIDYFYCSPLGRARATARPTLEALGRTAEICDWLREFDGSVTNPTTGAPRRAWDQLPSFVNEHDEFFDRDKWKKAPFFANSDVPEKYDMVCRELDALLARHGYVHEGHLFRVTHENTDTIAFFCHYGVECVLLSHLLSIPPVALWQGCVALTTSVTTLHTEERVQGIASLRCCGFSDVSHLYAGGEPASFQARFCEVYSNFDERHGDNDQDKVGKPQ